MKLSLYLPRFVTFMEKATKLADKSQENYERDVRLFINHVKDPDVAQLTPGTVLDWHTMLVDAGGAKATIEAKHAAVRRFLSYLEDYEEVAHAQKVLKALKKLDPPEDAPGSRREPYSLTNEQAQRLLKNARLHPGVGIRDEAFITLLLDSTCRREEIRDLLRSDIDFKTRQATVTGKGSKTRVVFFTERCKKLIERYLKATTDWPRQPGVENLFVSARGTPLSFTTINRVIKQTGQEAGIEKGVWTHILRHTAVTALGGGAHPMPIHQISQVAGHSDVRTTMGYMHTEPSDLKRAYDAATRR